MKFVPVLAVLMLCAAPVLAQEAAKDAAPPIEITGQNALEWNRPAKQYIARGDAMAVQGSFSVKADTLTADYREGADKGAQIYKFTAEGNVVIEDSGSKGYGDKLVYTVDDGKAVMTGKDLKLSGKDMTVTAKDRFEYYAADKKLVAVGAPVVTQGSDTLTADSVTAWLKQGDTAGADGKQSGGGLEKAEAMGNVVITTSSEKATGGRALYSGANNTATLYDNVKLIQGENVLEGSEAEMNLTTKISKLKAGSANGGRVRGVFFPSAKKN
jgi:lipopolysaccharide export system protein LptA